MKHIAKLRNKNEYWQLVGSQATQDIIQRIDRAYQLFFKHHKKGVRPPNFRKRIKYKSFTLKQAGYKFLETNKLKIGKRIYKFWKSRQIQGKVKTVTIKRNPLGEVFIFVVTDYIEEIKSVMTSKKVAPGRGIHAPAQEGATLWAGFDFGLKTFLTISDSKEIKSPLFLKQSLKQLKLASHKHSTKKKGSNNREKARKHLVRVHEKIVNRRNDWFWKLAHKLTDRYDYLFFETLNLKGMQRLWGRKINDLAFAEFLKILEFVASKKSKTIKYIDQWYPSSKTCSCCGHVLDKLPLDIRYWSCPSCFAKHGRDDNASKVILKVGISTLRLGNLSQSQTAISA